MRKTLVLAMLAATLAAVALASGSARADDAAPCGTLAGPPSTYAHVVWIWMENHAFSKVLSDPGSRVADTAPFIQSLAAECGVAANYHAISHPSLPNYIAAVSGTTQPPLSCTPSHCPQDGPTLFDQVPSWRTYAESMPANCYPSDTDAYPADHNPAVYFPALADACAADDVPLGTPTDGALASDLDAGTLPAFSLIVPDTCGSMEDCPRSAGDAWLQTWIPRITSSAAYQSGTTVVFVTWDEGNLGGSRGENCAQQLDDESCHVATLVISPYTAPGTTSTTTFDHYSLLRTTEELLGIDTYLGAASTATSMRADFGL